MHLRRVLLRESIGIPPIHNRGRVRGWAVSASAITIFQKRNLEFEFDRKSGNDLENNFDISGLVLDPKF